MGKNLRETRRKQILLAAAEVFSQEGFHKGTVDKIAQTAQLGKGTIYDYFSSKQEIFEEMLLSFLENYIDCLEESIDYNISIRDNFLSILEANEGFIDANTRLMEKSSYGFKNLSPDFKPQLRSLHRDMFSIINSLIEEGIARGEIRGDIDPQIISLLAINLVNGLKSSLSSFSLDLDLSREAIVDILFDGIKNQPN